jgi:hypothetical protein
MPPFSFWRPLFPGRHELVLDGQTYVLGDDTDWIRVAYLTLRPPSAPRWPV